MKVICIVTVLMMNEFVFSEEIEPQETESSESQEYWDVLIVDDEAAVHSVTKMVLKSKVIDGKKLRFHSVYNGQEAIDLLRKQPDFAVILLDVVMESDHAGLDACRIIRDELKLDTVRIILRTGQPGSTPEEEVILKYRINDYKEKNELTASKLFSCIVTAVRSYDDLVSLQRSQLALMKEKEAVEEINVEMQAATKEIVNKAKQLEHSNRYKTEFLANMSHELRTPLNSVLILSSLLRDNDTNNLDSDQIESLNIIHKSGNELLDLIEDILALSQLDTGKTQPFYQSHQLSDIFEPLCEKYGPLAQEKSLSFECVFDQNLPTEVIIDAQKVKQCISNILSNAIKFTGEGKVKINTSFDQAINSLIIAIEDTGIGISCAEVDGLFESFQQVDGSTSRAYGGVGLGLAIAKRMINLVNGTISLKSKEGEGSTFTLLIPLSNSLSITNAHPKFEKSLSADLEYKIDEQKTKKQVLIVDDNSRNVFSLIQGLKRRNMKIFVAEDGQSALKKLAKNPSIDIILMDIMMPMMDGNTAMRAIRASGKHNDLPIIAITAKALLEDRDEALSSGATECLSKPVDIHALNQLMDECLQS